MKRIVALLMVLAIIAMLAACTNTGSTNSPGTGGSETKTGGKIPNANPDGSVNLDQVAYFDPNYDYTQNPQIKMMYVVQQSGPLYEDSDRAYAHWAKQMNIKYDGISSANGDADMYLTIVQNLIDQGYTAFVLDPDTTIMPALFEMMDRNPNIAWMTQMATPRVEDANESALGGRMVHPFVGFDNYDAGVQTTSKLIEWKNENLKDVPWSDIGVICFDFSVSPPLHERVLGAKDTMLAAGMPESNWYVADTAAYGISMDAGQQAVAPIISTHSEYKYWLVNGVIDDFAQAAAQMIGSIGLTDNSCVVAFGGSALQKQFDAGQQDSWRYALFTAQNLYAEPIIGAVYAFANGWATTENIWPKWVNKHDHGGADHTYSYMRLPTVWLDFETYKTYLEWTDIYANASAYDYSQDGLTRDSFSALATVPAEYND